jgi:hypothetical protein
MNLIRIALQTSILTSVVLTSLIINGDAARSQQQACVITDDGTTVCGKPTTVKKEAKKPAQSSGYRKEVGNFVYTLKECKQSDATIKCDLAITNKGASKSNLWITFESKIIDSRGKSHFMSRIDIDGQSRTSSKVVEMVPGIAYATTLIFENMPESLTQAQVLQIALYGNNQNTLFRNILISN